MKKEASIDLIKKLSILYPNGYQEARFEHIIHDFEQKTYTKVAKK